MSLQGRSSFLNPDVQYVRGEAIVEWDMRDAGMSVIRSFALLPAVTVTWLEGLPKQERSIAVGKLRKDHPDFSEEFGNRFREVVDSFLSENEVPDGNVVAIKNDAIYLVAFKPKKVRFMECEFVVKHRYSSFAQLSGREFYLQEGLRGAEVDVKGLGGEVEEAHRNYMISLIGGAMRSAEAMKDRDLVPFLRGIREGYVTMSLEPGYYREMNPGLAFRLRGEGSLVYGLKDPPDDISLVDPWFNYEHFLVELIARLV